jgi:SAM-dependent methyltransferase
MSNPNVKIWDPDKIIKDLQWDNLLNVSRFANGRLLDIGCGKMPYKTIFKNKVTEYIGIDINSEVADIKEDFLKSKIVNSSFDTVLCTQVLEHTPEPQAFLNKINKVLKKNGMLILTVPFTGSLHEIPHDYFRYTKYGLEYMLGKAGFKVIYLKEEGNWISAIGQDTIFYLESSFNRFFLKYPKRLAQLSIQMLVRIFSYLPERLTKSSCSHINYIIAAKKN